MGNTSAKLTPCKRAEVPPSSAWFLLGLAVIFEITGALGLRFSKDSLYCCLQGLRSQISRWRFTSSAMS